MLYRVACSDICLITVEILDILNICLLIIRCKLCYCTKIPGNGVVHSM